MSIRSSEQGVSKSIIIIVIAAILLAGGVAAYFMTDGFGTRSDDEASQEASTDNKDKQSKSTNKADELPGWASDNYPIYPGSDVYTVSPSTVGGKTTYNIGTTVSGERAEIEQWYRDQYSTNGWTLDNEDAETIRSTNGDYTALVIVAKTLTANDDVVVTISAAKE